MIYKFKNGYGMTGLDAQAIGERLESLGAYTPAMVVEDARDEDSPTHAAFTWDDTVAGELFRLQEAGRLIRNIIVVRERTPREPRPPRGFVNVVERETGEHRYMGTAKALSDAEYRQQVIRRALHEAIAWRERYEHLREFAKVFAAIDKVSEQWLEAHPPKAA